jgi:hypothetical protein
LRGESIVVQGFECDVAGVEIDWRACNDVQLVHIDLTADTDGVHFSDLMSSSSSSSQIVSSLLGISISHNNDHGTTASVTIGSGEDIRQGQIQGVTGSSSGILIRLRQNSSLDFFVAFVLHLNQVETHDSHARVRDQTHATRERQHLG